MAFLVFAYDAYYPSGAAGDFVGGYATLEEAKEVGLRKNHDFVDILDTVGNQWHEKSDDRSDWTVSAAGGRLE